MTSRKSKKSKTVVEASNEWLDLAPPADATCWVEPPSDNPPPEDDADRFRFRGMRVFLGDTWQADYVRVEHADGTHHTRVIRPGDSRGRRYGAKRHRRAPSARKTSSRD